MKAVAWQKLLSWHDYYQYGYRFFVNFTYDDNSSLREWLYENYGPADWGIAGNRVYFKDEQGALMTYMRFS